MCYLKSHFISQLIPKNIFFKKLAYINYNKYFLWRNLCCIWKKNNTPLFFLLSNCPQVLNIFYDWTSRRRWPDQPECFQNNSGQPTHCILKPDVFLSFYPFITVELLFLISVNQSCLLLMYIVYSISNILLAEWCNHLRWWWWSH